MSNRKTVALLCGGKSPEHKISLISAQNIIKSIDRAKYNLKVIGIDQNGTWHYYGDHLSLNHPNDAENVSLIPQKTHVLFSQNPSDKALFLLGDTIEKISIDVIYPILHGNNGEDGSIQGMSKLAGLPCVGCGINGSAISMDKDVMKKVLRDAEINVANGITIKPNNRNNWNFSRLCNDIGEIMYVKPATLGSSIGVSRVKNETEFNNALDLAFQFDDKVLVEEEIIGREIECAVLGNDEPAASCIGEIKAANNFYTFENKYVNANGALLSIPADLSKETTAAAQNLALRAYKAMDCCGLSRVDMFYKTDGTLLINEVNTIPGFTNISMYPKLWEHEGIKQKELISKLIEFAFEKHQKESNFKQFA